MLNLICAVAHFVIFTVLQGAAMGSVMMQGMTSEISENPNLRFGKVVDILRRHIGAGDWYLQCTACAIFAKEK